MVGEGGNVFGDFGFYAALGVDYCDAEDAELGLRWDEGCE